jgi:hypothetical protein
MLKLKPASLKKNGKTEFVVLTARDFSAIEELIQEALDIRFLETARAQVAGRPGISLEEMKRRLRTKNKRRKSRA